MNRPPPISNSNLKPGEIPPPDADWTAIKQFAMTFNGYEAMGGFEACGDLANHSEKCRTLSDLRSCLFFEYRRHNHFCHDPNIQTLAHIRDLLDRIRAKVEAGERD